jgi:hypothetical protein
LAGAWARSQYGVQEVACRANWYLHGKGAGHERNARMLELGPELVVAFPGGRGTANMIARAERAGVEVMRIS